MAGQVLVRAMTDADSGWAHTLIDPSWGGQAWDSDQAV